MLANVLESSWGNQLSFDVWNFFGGLLTGAIGGALLTFSLTKNLRAGANSSIADQSRASAGGDITGRDKR